MAEFEQKLNEILENPEAMDQIMSLARSLSGSTQEQNGMEDPENREPAETELPTEADFFRKGVELLGSARPTGGRGEELMQALSPYLKEERRERLRRALKLARTTHLIRTIVSSMGEKGDKSDV